MESHLSIYKPVTAVCLVSSSLPVFFCRSNTNIKVNSVCFNQFILSFLGLTGQFSHI